MNRSADPRNMLMRLLNIKMVRDEYFIIMVVFMKENLKQIYLTVKELASLRMVLLKLAIGRKIGRAHV